MSAKPKLTLMGRIFILLFIAGCAYGAYALFSKKPIGITSRSTDHPSASEQSDDMDPSEKIEIGIAYGTEKERWLKWAVSEFEKSKEGASIRINLIPKGSLEGAQALLEGDEKIHVWSPASALYTDVFIQEWTLKHNSAPIAREEALALSPMVFVFWSERFDSFSSKYSSVSFDSIRQALVEPGGWDAIASKPQWGLFKFGHTHPNQSNSGLMNLTLMAYEYHGKNRNLTLKDILDPSFQSWMKETESAVSGLSNSTGNMMKDMVLRGPSSYDALCVYENVVIDYLKNAKGRWGDLHVAYPALNMWNENPYYIINAPWSDAAHKKAAGRFLDFLISEPIQKAALTHGFRPGNPAVPIIFPESPFTLYKKNGLKVDIPTVCEPPKAEVINNLLGIWQRQR